MGWRMLRKLVVDGFKPFRHFSITFSNLDVLVGRNNMGKSTLIDALSLIATESNHHLRRDAVVAPADSVLAEAGTVFAVDKRRIKFPTANVHHEYSQAEAYVVAEFEEKIRLHLSFTRPPENTCFFAVSRGSQFLDNPETVRNVLRRVSIGVLPPISPFDENELLLTKDHVRETFGTHLTPRHFRNMWYHDLEEFEEFRKLLGETWPGIDISTPEPGVSTVSGQVELSMFYQEERMSRELAWAGHGMQVWLQVLSYLAKMKDCRTLVLDEPEISLHSDMQRKLVQVLRSRANQIILATHSVDIINEVPPERIVVVDKRMSSAKRLESIKQVQQVVEGLGSVQNVNLLGILRSKFVLFLEGGDRRILAGFARALGLGSFPDPRLISVVELEGEANWRRLKDFNWVLTNTIGERVRAYVLLDRDYRTEAQVQDLVTTLRRAGVGIHVWQRKEIENYTLSAPAIRRCLDEEMGEREFPMVLPPREDIERLLSEMAERHRQYVRSQLLGQIIEERRHSREHPSTTVSAFDAEFDRSWANPEYRLARAAGKDLLSDVASWSQSTFGASLSIASILRHMAKEDVPSEVAITLREVVRRSED